MNEIPDRVDLHSQWLDADNADRLLLEVKAQAAWKQDHIVIQGNTIALPRLTAWHGDRGYRYSGIQNTPAAWTPALLELRDRLEKETGASFNSVLCNLYRTGQDSVAWHADDERELGPEPTIASVSLGATRKFSLKRKDGTGSRLDIALQHGDLLIMKGDTQKHWVHQLPKTKTVNTERINLTFRQIG